MEVATKRKNNPFFYIYLVFSLISMAFSSYVAIAILVAGDEPTNYGAPFIFIGYLFTLVPFIISFIPFAVFKVKTKKGGCKEHKRSGLALLLSKVIINLILLVITLIYII